MPKCAASSAGAFALCGNKNHEEVAVLRLDAKSIHVAEYLTEMPPRPLLERKLHEAILLAQEQLARRFEKYRQKK